MPKEEYQQIASMSNEKWEQWEDSALGVSPDRDNPDDTKINKGNDGPTEASD